VCMIPGTLFLVAGSDAAARAAAEGEVPRDVAALAAAGLLLLVVLIVVARRQLRRREAALDAAEGGGDGEIRG
jgi:hypothetical protein